MADRPLKIGIIGCGAICGAYLHHARGFPILEIAACADINTRAAEDRASQFGIPRVCSVEEMMRDDSIELILNLTIPKAHAPISLQAIEAGKHVYSEKPLAVDLQSGRQLIEAAGLRGVRVGCAPDTFLGAGIQTARKLIDEGAIGRPVGFTAFMMCPGHESWHPNPEFYYEPGGGPMFDMGPYYLTALLNLLGPVRSISGMASIAIPQRAITAKDWDTGAPVPKFGQKLTVTTPDHICGTMEFANGAVGTIITSFAARFATYDGRQPITIYGTHGTLRVPDPNEFDGPVHLRKNDDPDWTEVPHAFIKGYGRAVGVADMAMAIRSGRPHRVSGEQALAVLDLMQGFLHSSQSGSAYSPQTPYQRPAPMPTEGLH